MTEQGKSNQMERTLTNEGTTKFHHVEKDNKGYFFNLSKLGYNNIRLSIENCRGLIIGYYKPKKENN